MASVGSILGLGNPLLDITASVPQEVFDKYGVKPNNAILAEESHLPLYEELTANYSVEYTAGGATQNAVRVAQWMIQSPAQATSFIGAVGQDKFGETLEASATKDNVSVHYMKLKETPTGTCAVLLDDSSERSLVANISAAGAFKYSHLETTESKEVVEKAQIYYIAGFFLTHSTDSALAIAKQSLKDGKTFSMNLSAPFICEFFLDPLNSVMPYIDLVFGNESEAQAYAKAMKWETTEIPEIAQKIAQMDRADGAKAERTVIITQGSESTCVATPSGFTLYEVPKIPKEEIVDVNGAGDSFVGGFLSQLVAGKEMVACVTAGHWAAGVVIKRSGCTFPETCEFSA